MAGLIACLLIYSSSFSKPEYTFLAQNPTWLALLHYKDGKSEIDDTDFFLAKDGYINPKSELEATITAFITSTEKGDNHPICKYPARYHFLKKFLRINPKVNPNCKKLKEFIKQIEPHSISLIFSDAYINSPASMYGHTFLRIDPPVKSKLLGYAVNYAANADETEGFLYYIKGIFGLYKGYFSVFPYYKKIFEYNNLESRDLWEYTLKLPKDKVILITLHIWELQNKYVYYYFFNKNCSYQILHLIDLGNPELKAIDYFNFWTIPTDTIRFLKSKNLIENVHYRPSASSKIKAFIQSNPDITEKDIETAYKIAKFKIEPELYIKKNLPVEHKAKIMELAKLIFMYYSVKEKMPYKEYRKKFLKLLKARSKLHYVIRYSLPKKVPPDKGHRSKMFALNTGSDNGDKFISFKYRTAYHGLDDDDNGYIFGSEILFPYIEIRNFPDKNKTVLEELSLIKIRSYSIRDIIFKPVSWLVTTSFKRDWDLKEKHLFWNFSTGMGLSYGKYGRYLYSGIIKTKLQLDTQYINKSRLNIGTEFVFLGELNKNKIIFSFYPFYSVAKKEFFGFSSGLTYNFSIDTNTAFQTKFSLSRIYYKNRYSLTFSINRFF